MTDVLSEHLESHRRLLRALVWRVTGVAADADEIVQETYLRALTAPPPDLSRSLRPWLMRVAMNLARDRLRARRRRERYASWLPGPLVEEVATPDALVARAEGANMAWMRAAEALTPGQRAVLVLREVLELDVGETARALQMSPERVRVTHHRARQALLGAEARLPGAAHGPVQREQAEALLMRLLQAVGAGDGAEVRALLHEDVVMITDGGRRFRAAGVPVVGADKVTAVQLYFVAHSPPFLRFKAVSAADPWVSLERDPAGALWPTHVLVGVEVRGGKIAAIYSHMVPEKLAGA
ncbi:MAG: sigma-70 family RNA polymerase sigma factor [Deltaproteobacteria bacterium]|nr:sigma-70 family RNA polymerase sigma factor [Deltaproteobacteria bacterium]